MFDCVAMFTLRRSRALKKELCSLQTREMPIEDDSDLQHDWALQHDSALPHDSALSSNEMEGNGVL